jgi:glycosyltransferase involved in cell wall biosynthesis
MIPRQEPLISVITIFLDAERFLGEAVDSVLAQTCSRWELLLVDDGSTDASSAIARSYAARYPERIRYLDHPAHQNRGMSASRNLGVRESAGEFVAFLDADDVFLPEKLERQSAIMRAHPDAAMVYGRALIWYAWTGRSEDMERDETLELGVEEDTLVHPPRLFHLLLRNRVQSPIPSNVLIRREAFHLVGGFEEAFPDMYEDQAFFFKVHLSLPVFVSGECWLRYRQHADSCTARINAGNYYARRRGLMEWLESHLAQQNIVPESEVWTAVQRELWRTRHPGWQRILDVFGSIPGAMRRRASRILTPNRPAAGARAHGKPGR